MIYLEEIIKEKEWDTVTEGLDLPLTQTFVYGEIQKGVGREIKRFSILNDDEVIGAALFVSFHLVGKLSYWYAPYGPILSSVSKEIIQDLKSELKKKFGKSSVFIRLDFTLGATLYNDSIKKYFTRAATSSYHGAYFQPRAEWYTDINKTPDEILQAMHSKTRYSVRLAEKKGVVVKISTENLSQKLPDFLRLMKQTALRNKFAIHGDEYYLKYFKEVEKTHRGFIVESVYKDEILASHFVFVVDNVAHYVFGASSDEHKELCAPYAAHFEAMLHAKTMGAEFYNFGAVSVGKDDREWQGLTVFKQKFGGGIKMHSPLYDMVFRSFWYYIYIIRKVIKSYL